MTYKTFNDIYKSLSPTAIAHAKTVNGDKVCIKDNKEAQRQGVILDIYDEYIRIMSISYSEKSEKHTEIFISFSDIIQIEAQTTINTEKAES